MARTELSKVEEGTKRECFCPLMVGKKTSVSVIKAERKPSGNNGLKGCPKVNNNKIMQKCYKIDSKMCQNRCKNMSKSMQKCVKINAKMCQNRFKNVSKSMQKNARKCMAHGKYGLKGCPAAILCSRVLCIACHWSCGSSWLMQLLLVFSVFFSIWGRLHEQRECEM